MAVFNLPFGPLDPRLLTTQRSAAMTPGTIPGPVAAVPLVSGYRPPGTGGGGMPGAPQGMPGFNVQDGAAGLGAAMAGFRMPGAAPGLEPERTAGDADLGGYSKPGGMVDTPSGPLPNPNDPASYVQGAATPANPLQKPSLFGGIDQWDILQNQWMPKAGFMPGGGSGFGGGG